MVFLNTVVFEKLQEAGEQTTVTQSLLPELPFVWFLGKELWYATVIFF